MFTILGIKYYEVEDLAKLLGVSISTALGYIRKGRLPARWVGGRWIINEAALQRWLDPSFWEGDNTRAVFRSLAILAELEKRGIEGYEAIKRQVLESSTQAIRGRAKAIANQYWAAQSGKAEKEALEREALEALRIKRKRGRPPKARRKPGRPRKTAAPAERITTTGRKRGRPRKAAN
jgi:excisionase family DNA binding protein